MQRLRFALMHLSALLFGGFLLSTHAVMATEQPSPLSQHSQDSALTVLLTDLNIQLQYQQAPRWNQVLADTLVQLQAKQSTAPYWLAAQLVDLSRQQEVDKLKPEVVNSLNELKQHDNSYSPAVDALLAQLNQSQFHFRHFLTFDYDLVRIQQAYNPIIKGDLSLYLPNRSSHIEVLGAITEGISAEFIEHGLVSDYVADRHFFDTANSDVASIIQPDGAVFSAPFSYWNQERRFLAPGAIIFIEFDDLPSQFAELNQQIVALLRYREPLVSEAL